MEQARDNEHKTRLILYLYERMKTEIPALTRSQYAIHALDFLFDRPIFAATEFLMFEKIPKPTGKRVLQVLREHGILRTLRESSGRRPATLCFRELLNIAEGDEIF